MAYMRPFAYLLHVSTQKQHRPAAAQGVVLAGLECRAVMAAMAANGIMSITWCVHGYNRCMADVAFACGAHACGRAEITTRPSRLLRVRAGGTLCVD